MVISNELKPGNYFSYDGNIYVVLDTLHNKLPALQHGQSMC